MNPPLPALSPLWIPAAVTVAPAGNSIPFLGADSERWGLIVWAQIGGAFMRPVIPADPAFIGMPVPAAAPFIELYYNRVGTIVQSAWVLDNPGPPVQVMALVASWRFRRDILEE